MLNDSQTAYHLATCHLERRNRFASKAVRDTLPPPVVKRIVVTAPAGYGKRDADMAPSIVAERNAAWRALYDAGMTLEDIALDYGVSTPRVTRVKAANGWPERRRHKGVWIYD
jgi:hypothetical protein